MDNRKPARILCLDDEPRALSVRKALLEFFGFTVFTATSGEEALRIFREGGIDLVISDHLLRGLLGTQVAAKMKTISPQIPILILSGVPDLPEDIDVADCFLSKLEPPPVLLETVNKLLGIEPAAESCPAFA